MSDTHGQYPSRASGQTGRPHRTGMQRSAVIAASAGIDGRADEWDRRAACVSATVSSRGRESDRLIVPMTPPKGTRRAEGRGRPEGNSHREGKVRTQGRGIVPANLRRVNEAAKRDKRARFTALLHHVDVVALERAYRRVKRKAARGGDGETGER